MKGHREYKPYSATSLVHASMKSRKLWQSMSLLSANWQNIVILRNLKQNVVRPVCVWHRQPCSLEMFAH